MQRFRVDIGTILVVAALGGVCWTFSASVGRRPVGEVPEPWVVVRSFLAQNEASPDTDRSWYPWRDARLQSVGSVEREALTPDAVAILRDAFAAATADDRPRQRANLDIFNRMTGLRWPRVAGLPRVHVVMSNPSSRTPRRGWLLDEGDKTVLRLTDDFKIVSDSKTDGSERLDGVRAVEPGDIQLDLQDYVRLPARLAQRSDGTQLRDDYEIHFFGPGLELRLLRMSVAAAQCGLRDESRALMRELLRLASDRLTEINNGFVQDQLERAADELNAHPGPGWLINRDDDWREFVRTCRELRTLSPESRLQGRLDTLIEGIEKGLAAAPPSFVTKPRADLTRDETIGLLIHQLRDFSAPPFMGWGPDLFSRGSPAYRLVMIGPPALPLLVAAVDDLTPCRTCDYDRHARDSSKLFRRQDLVFECLQRITGCTFFVGSTWQDEPVWRRAAAADHVRRWWQLCRGGSQADMLHAYLRTLPENSALREYEATHPECRRSAVLRLAHLEGPENMLHELQKLPKEWFRQDEPTAYDQFVPSRPAEQAFRRLNDKFWSSTSITTRNVDELLTYGDSATYASLARLAIDNERIEDPDTGEKRFAALVPQARPAILFEARHVDLAVKFGRNWSIPLLFAMLRNSAEESVEGSRRESIADRALVALTMLTGRDFGYDPQAPHAERLAVFEAARAWADQASWRERGELIQRDHPPVRADCDLFLSEQRIAAIVQAIASGDPASRHETIAQLGDVYSYRIQRVLLDALDREPESRHRTKILDVLRSHPMLWHVPQLAHVFEHDAATDCRLAAGRMLLELLHEESRDVNLWGTRLETVEAALDAARRMLHDEKVALPVREAALDLLVKWDSPIDVPLLARIDRRPEFRHRVLVHEFADILGAYRAGDDLVAELSRVLEQGRVDERRPAAEALCRLGAEGAPALPALLHILDSANDDRFWIPDAVIRALVDIRASGTAEKLLDRIPRTDLSIGARDAAVTVLSRIDLEAGPALVVEHLIAALREGDDERRQWAAEWLARYARHAAAAIPELRRSLGRGDREVRVATETALRAVEAAQTGSRP